MAYVDPGLPGPGESSSLPKYTVSHDHLRLNSLSTFASRFGRSRPFLESSIHNQIIMSLMLELAIRLAAEQSLGDAPVYHQQMTELDPLELTCSMSVNDRRRGLAT